MYKLQTASYVDRNALGAELLRESGEVVATILRLDTTNTLEASTHGHTVPLQELERLIRYARERLDPFEDGTPFPSPSDTPCKGEAWWIPEDAVRGWLQLLSLLSDARLDSDDWNAIAAGLESTDADANRWFTYPLDEGNRAPMVVHLARDTGSGVVHVSAQGSPRAITAACAASDIVQAFRVASRRE